MTSATAVGAEEGTGAESEAERLAAGQASPEIKALAAQLNREAHEAVNRALGTLSEAIDFEDLPPRGREGRWIEALDKMGADAHSGQVDKQEMPYVEHVRAVAHSVSAEAQPVALFHDLLEDMHLTEEHLREVLTPDELAAVKILTRDHHDQTEGAYERYIERIASAEGKPGELAHEVKHADLQRNLVRLPPELERLRRRYERAPERLGRDKRLGRARAVEWDVVLAAGSWRLSSARAPPAAPPPP